MIAAKRYMHQKRLQLAYSSATCLQRAELMLWLIGKVIAAKASILTPQ
jgi:hypothetical protein